MEKTLDGVDFHENKNVLIETILEHTSNVNYKGYKWAFATMPYTEKEKINFNDFKNHLIINIDLFLLRGYLQTLIEIHNFQEDETYNDPMWWYNGVLLIYSL